MDGVLRAARFADDCAVCGEPCESLLLAGGSVCWGDCRNEIYGLYDCGEPGPSVVARVTIDAGAGNVFCRGAVRGDMAVRKEHRLDGRPAVSVFCGTVAAGELQRARNDCICGGRERDRKVAHSGLDTLSDVCRN